MAKNDGGGQEQFKRDAKAFQIFLIMLQRANTTQTHAGIASNAFDALDAFERVAEERRVRSEQK